MGNVISEANLLNEIDSNKMDLKWIATSASLLFNDDFLEESFSKLPPFTGTEEAEEKTKEGGVVQEQPNSSYLRLVELIAPGKETKSVSVCDFEDLGKKGGPDESTPYGHALRMRLRLLLRIHLALLRQSGAAGEAAEECKDIFKLPTTAISDPAALLNTLSLRACLTMATRLRTIDPEMFSDICSNLFETFTSAAHLSLSKLRPDSPEYGMVISLQKFRTSILSQSDSKPEEKAHAIALLFAIGMARGSVADLVSVCSALLQLGAPLLPSTLPLMERLTSHTNMLKLSLPASEAVIETFSAKITDATQESCAGAGANRTSMACDGTYVYCLEEYGDSYTVLKIATGLGSTVKGNVESQNSKLMEQISDRVKGSPASASGVVKGRLQLVVVDNKLYIHNSYLLQSNQLAVVSAEDLELLDIVEVPCAEGSTETLEAIVSLPEYGSSAVTGANPEVKLTTDFVNDAVSFDASEENPCLIIDLGKARAISSFSWKASNCSAVSISLAADTVENFIFFKEVGSMSDERANLSGEEVITDTAFQIVRYLRISGKGRPEENPSGISIGNIIVKAQVNAPMLYTTEGRYLMVVNRNCVAIYEPVTFELVSTVPISLPSDIDLKNATLLTNGSQMSFITHPPLTANDDGPTTLSTNTIHLGLLGAAKTVELNFKFREMPCAFCYDAKNNSIWGWNPVWAMLFLWGNDGLAPRFGPARPSEDQLISSVMPKFRFEAISKLDSSAEVDVAKILCKLDEFSMMYHAPAQQSAHDTDDFYRISVVSSGMDVKDAVTPAISVRGKNCISQGPGFANLAVLSNDFEVSACRQYSIADSSMMMSDWVASLPEGSIVLVQTTQAPGSGPCLETMSKAMQMLGYDYNPNEKDQTKKLTEGCAFAMIGKKGAAPGSVPYKIAARGPRSIVHISQLLPLTPIPLSIEVTKETLGVLVDLVLEQLDQLTQVKEELPLQSLVGRSILLSTFRILAAHVYQLCKAVPAVERAQYFETDKLASFKNKMLELVDSPPSGSGFEVIADAALNLFLSCIGIFFPTTEAQCSLMISYLNQYQEGTLSASEGGILAVLMERISEPASLALLMKENKADPQQGTSKIFGNLLQLVTDVTCKSINTPQTEEKKKGDIAKAARDMLSYLMNHALSSSCQALIVGKDAASNEEAVKEAQAANNHLLELVQSVASNCCTLLESAYVKASISSDLPKAVDDALNGSILQSLLPTLTSIIMYLAEKAKAVNKEQMIELGSHFNTVLQKLAQLVRFLKPEKLVILAGAGGGSVKKLSKVMESAHNYADNTHTIEKLSFPKAKRIVIVFDEQSRTEGGYDYIQFFKDEGCQERWHESPEKFCGRNGDQNFPGCGGREPLVIEGDTAWVLFHSDGSNNDWGYKFTATAEIKSSSGPTGPRPGHWLVSLERTLATCVAYLAASLLLGTPWGGETEELYQDWLNDEMLQATVVNDGLTEEHTIFLNSIGERKAGTLGAKLCEIMKKNVPEDQGNIPFINQAVYTTCAALIKQNGLVVNALAVAKGAIDKPSDALLKVWKSGQKMRQYFSFGELADELKSKDGDVPPVPLLSRGPSVFEGADTTAVQAVAKKVTEKAEFVLSLKAMQHSEESVAKKRWGLLSMFAHSEVRSQRLTSSGAERFAAVVHSAVSADNLRHIFDFRRKMAKKHKGALSRTEKVLRFVQGHTNLEELVVQRSNRDSRGSMRVQGLEMFASLVENISCDLSLSLVLGLYVAALRTPVKEDSQSLWVHYLQNVKGCSFEVREALRASFQKFLKCCVWKMLRLSTDVTKDTITPALKTVSLESLQSLLQSVSIDCVLEDHKILEECQLPAALEGLLSHENDDVRKTAWTVFEVLLMRGVGMKDSQSLNFDVEGLSDFSNSLLKMLQIQVDTACQGMEEYSKVASGPIASVDSGIILLSGQQAISKEGEGCTCQDVPLGLKHSFSLWFNRNRGNEELLAKTKFEDGDLVKRGKEWNKNHNSDGGPEQIGTVKKVEGDNLRVVWPNKTEEVRPIAAFAHADPQLCGSIYKKGTLKNLGDKELDKSWNQYGLQVAADGTVQFKATAGSLEPFFVEGESIIPPNCWTHLTVVCAKDTVKLFVNGELDGSANLPGALLSQGDSAVSKNSVVIESDHPYADNSSREWLVEVPGAASYKVTFDGQTATEPNYDYVSFYLMDGTLVGKEKYSGGREGSEKLFPGIGSEPPLEISAPKFKVVFTSDNSKNDWGFKFTAVAELVEEQGSAPRISPTVHCPGNHALVDNITQSGGRRCDLCRNSIPDGIRALSCRTCNFDACPTCFEIPAAAIVSVNSDGAPVHSSFDASHTHMTRTYCGRTVGQEGYQAACGNCDGRCGPTNGCQCRSCYAFDAPSEETKAEEKQEEKKEDLEEVQAESDPEQPVLNQSPFYFGCSPNYVGGLSSANGFIANIVAFQKPLTRKEIQEICERTTPTSSLSQDIELLVLNVLALLCKSTVDMPCAAKAKLAHPQVLEKLIRLLFKGTFKTRLAASKVCEQLLPLLPAEAAVPDKAEFVRNILLQIGQDQCVWIPNPTTELRLGALEAQSLADSKVKLLRSLAVAPSWSDTVLGLLGSSIQSHDQVLAFWNKIQDTELQDSASALSFLSKSPELETFLQLSGALTLLSGNFENLRIGAPALYRSEPGSMPEECTIVAFTAPPSDFSGQDKEKLSKTWKDIEFGEAVLVTISSDAGKVQCVPFTQLAPTSVSLSTAFLDNIMNQLWLMEAWLKSLVELTVTDPRPKYLPKTTTTDVELVFESSHPYADNTDKTETVEIPGAESITLTFDPQCKTENNCDYVRILKKGSDETYGPDFTGSDDGMNWPGFGGRDPLVIPSDSCRILFHSDGSNNNWGYKVTVTGRATVNEEPPVLPVLLSNVAKSLLRTQAIRVVNTFLSASEKFVPLLSTFAPALMKASLESLPEPACGPSAPKKLTFESKHPYDNGMNYGEEVCIKGAKKLLISFDPQSKTESCDYLIFYKESDKVARWSDQNFAGGRDGGSSNFPGIQGRPPLEIDSDHFYFTFYSDGSVNDWGYLFTVTAVMGAVSAASSSSEAGFHLSSLGAILYDGCPPQVLPSNLEQFEQSEIATATSVVPMEVVEENKLDETLPPADAIWVDILPQDPSSEAPSSSSSLPSGPSAHYLTPDGAKADDNTSQLYGLKLADVQQGRLAKALNVYRDTLNLASTLHAQNCINTLLALWPQDSEFKVSSLGTIDNFVGFLKKMFADKSNTDALTSLEKRIVEIIREDSAESVDFIEEMVKFSMNHLKDGVVRPKARACKKVVMESPSHPYGDSEDFNYDLKIQGAKKIFIVFDDQCESEKNCDYVRFWKSQDTSDTSDGNAFCPNLSGMKGSSDQNWPGVGCNPPLIIDGEYARVQWHSDGSNHNWGYKFTAYGIVEEPSPEAIAEYEKKKATAKADTITRDLSLWLLQLFSKEKVPLIKEKLFHPQAQKSILKYLLKCQTTESIRSVTNLLASLFKDISDVKVNPELLSIMKSLARKLKERFTQAFTDNADSANNLLHAAITVANAVQSISSETPAPSNDAPKDGDAECPEVTFDTNRIGNGFELALGRQLLKTCSGAPIAVAQTAVAEQSFEKGIWKWDVKILSDTAETALGITKVPSGFDPSLPLVNSPGSLYWKNGNIEVGTSKELVSSYGPIIGKGDLITVELDLDRGTLGFYRNSCFLGIAVGPPDSGAALIVELEKNALYYPAVSVAGTGDVIQLFKHPVSTLSELEFRSSQAQLADPFQDPKKAKDPMMQLQSGLNYIDSISRREIPLLTVSKYFLEGIKKNTSVVLDTGVGNFYQSLTIPGASALMLTFQKAKSLTSEHTVSISAPTISRTYIFKGGAEPVQEISVGDKVIRGSSWSRGDEDGGAGTVGIVKRITEVEAGSGIAATEDLTVPEAPTEETPVAEVVIPKATCEGGHDLTPVATTQDGSVCNKCSATVNCSSLMYSCQPCNYNICFQCAQNTLLLKPEDSYTATHALLIRTTPALDSEEVTTLPEGTEIKAGEVPAEYADHELIRSGRRLRITSPCEGYCSRFSEVGAFLIQTTEQQRAPTSEQPVPTTSPSSNIKTTERTVETSGRSFDNCDDEMHPLFEPAPLTIQTDEKLTKVTARCKWNDQGWGNQKGRIFIRLLRNSNVLGTVDLFGIAPHSEESLEKQFSEIDDVFKQNIIALQQPGDVIDVAYVVGGGGGHALTVSSFSLQAVFSSLQRPTEPQRIIEKKQGCLVQVAWGTGSLEGEDYRWNIDGNYDIKIIHAKELLTKPYTVKGDSVNISVQSLSQEGMEEEKSEVPPSFLKLGRQDSLELPKLEAFKSTGSFSFEAWIRPESTGVDEAIFSRFADLDGLGLRLFTLARTSGGQLLLRMTNAAMEEGINIQGGAVEEGKWTHVALVVLENNNCFLYVNGEKQKDGTFSGGERCENEDCPLKIGSPSDPEFVGFAGHIYDIRLWSKGLEQTDVAAGLTNFPLPSTEGLLLHVALNDPNGIGEIIVVGGSWDESISSPTKTEEKSVQNCKIEVEPVYTVQSVSTNAAFKEAFQRFCSFFNPGDMKHDLALVAYVNEVATKKGLSLEQMTSTKWNEIAPTQDDLVRHPKVNELIGLAPSAEENKENWLPPIEARFKIIQGLNVIVKNLVPNVDFSAIDKPWSMAAAIVKVKGLLFTCLKTQLWDEAIASTSAGGGGWELKISRSRAAKHARNGGVDNEGRFSVVGQAFRQIHPMPSTTLRIAAGNRLYTCIFMGERSIDAGGPYRESWSMYAQELMSNALPLFVRSPNGRHGVGYNRDKWLPNPGSNSSTHTEMFSFIGKLMGIAMRTKEYMAVNFAEAFWKLVTGEHLSLDDLEAVDYMLIQSMDSLRNIDKQGVTEELFGDVVFETFTTVSSDDRSVELKPNGAATPVTFATRCEYAESVLKYRLHEFDKQVAAVRTGLGMIVPLRLLALFSAKEAERLVCGSPELDLKLLREATEYSGVSENDQHVKYFWQALESFTNEECSMFVKFTWGRSRLPLTLNDFSQRFKIQSFDKAPADNYYPVAHTCFFSLELPRYTSLDIMKEKLRYAIYNCQDIDGDEFGAGMAAAAMGFED